MPRILGRAHQNGALLVSALIVSLTYFQVQISVASIRGMVPFYTLSRPAGLEGLAVNLEDFLCDSLR